MTRDGRHRRTPAIVALAAAALAALPGCAASHASAAGGGDPAVGGGTVPGGAICTPSGSQHIRLVTGPDVSRAGVRNRLVALWDERCPRHPVDLVVLPPTADGQRSQMVAAEQSGNTDYDVLNLDVTWTPEFAADHLIRPLAGTARSDFLHNAWDTATDRHHKVWAIPFNSDAGLLFYRTDAGFSGAPRDWAHILADLHVSKQGGYVTQLAPYEGLTVNVLEAVWDEGGDLVDDNGEVESTSSIQKGLDDLRWERQWLMPPSVDQAHEAESLQAFAQGKATFLRGWPYMYDVLVADGLKPGAQFDVARLPGVNGPGFSVLGGQDLAVAAHSRNPELARQLIDFLTSPQSERCLLEGGFAAARTGAYSTSASAPRCPLPSLATAGSTETSGVTGALPPYSGVLYAALVSARPRPKTPYYGAFTQFVQADVEAFLGNRKENVVTDMTGDLRRVLAGRL
jgi:multiple sugar transport system substrate-binding protein